jgi:uncharacterized membrane protein YqjE
VGLSRGRVTEPRTSGLLASLRQLRAAFVATLHSRAQLLSLELQQERVRLTRMLLLGAAAFFFLLLGAFAATIFLIVLFWDSQRLVVIGFLTLLYFGIAAGLVVWIKRDASRAKRPFAATVEQLRRDREHLGR